MSERPSGLRFQFSKAVGSYVNHDDVRTRCRSVDYGAIWGGDEDVERCVCGFIVEREVAHREPRVDGSALQREVVLRDDVTVVALSVTPNLDGVLTCRHLDGAVSS